MKFKQLDITGFKSFSDKTTFLIEEGLTGIVGLMDVESLTQSSL